MGKTERNKIIDISKGIALLLVIFGHLKWEEGLAFFYSCRFYYGFMRFIYSFHIIIFFIFIGFLYSEKTIKSKNNLSAVKNIFATYIIFLIIYFVNFLIFNYHSKDIELIFVDLLYAVFFSNSFYLNKLGIHGFLWFLPAYCFSILIYV